MSNLIDRQAAIDVMLMAIDDDWEPDYATDRMNELPSAQPTISCGHENDVPSAQLEQRWIPCSERLPEKPNMYTVTDSKGDVVRFVFTGTESSKKYWRRCAKAWMPLPEPYREEGDS